MISFPSMFGIIFIIYLIISIALLSFPFRQYFLDQRERKKRSRPDIKTRNYSLLRRSLYYSIFDPDFLVSTYLAFENKSGMISYKYKSLLSGYNNFLTENYISIQHESDLVTEFLEIEKFRKNGLFDYKIIISNAIDTNNSTIPSLILISLIAVITRKNLTTTTFFKLEINKTNDRQVKILLTYSYNTKFDNSVIIQQLKLIIADVRESLSYLYRNDQFRIKQYAINSSDQEYDAINIELILPFSMKRHIENTSSMEIPNLTYRSLNYGNRSLNLICH